MLSNIVPLLLLSSSAAAAVVSRAPPAGFVTTKGNVFKLDGKDFYFAGSNAYYLPFDELVSDVEAGLKAAKKAGLNVMRTWGFNDKNRTTITGGLPNYGGEGAGPSPNVMQWWNNGTSQIDLQPFDKVVDAAKKTDMKLIVALTNNWADYGGMDVYTVNLGGKYHDDFYRDPKIKKAFKRYVREFVNRYKKSANIMAWELANEPRCGADGVRNLPRSETCTPALITAWIKETSAYVKELDPHHLVTWGGEGGFNRKSDDWAYNGSDGGDFDEELKIATIDFGVFHSYPDWWSKTVEWTTQWIKDHAAAARAVGKPVVHEEYGWLTDDKRQEYLGISSNLTRTEVVGLWQATSLKEKMPDMYWQFGYSGYSYGRNNDDGFTIFLDDAEAKKLVYEHAAAVNKLNHR
ncbi:glycoside hydrolase family 5 protein [Dothidotthia symphoricarpi CBS 119687]|uniref:mannan endo-1,4-beta-mannosidase n=1 Tax=Dothidotthia symphoricarpi CBS 119687 TaxID=1392245 RepID=A0A6A6A123_9PLEO|nr:glycoside hydrolase family 5 protein [Dothidotthia symphoricarpi CBS 119687]KAF2124261.1 glycoside hydrolase family 5 protein [Dothidotthia symphoricarpi CBS 119687]